MNYERRKSTILWNYPDQVAISLQSNRTDLEVRWLDHGSDLILEDTDGDLDGASTEYHVGEFAKRFGYGTACEERQRGWNLCEKVLCIALGME